MQSDSHIGKHNVRRGRTHNTERHTPQDKAKKLKKKELSAPEKRRAKRRNKNVDRQIEANQYIYTSAPPPSQPAKHTHTQRENAPTEKRGRW